MHGDAIELTNTTECVPVMGARIDEVAARLQVAGTPGNLGRLPA